MLFAALLSVGTLLSSPAEPPSVLLDCAVENGRLTLCKVVEEDVPGTSLEAIQAAAEIEVPADLTVERLQVRIKLKG